jgi:hypothetical protein
MPLDVVSDVRSRSPQGRAECCLSLGLGVVASLADCGEVVIIV